MNPQHVQFAGVRTTSAARAVRRRSLRFTGARSAAQRPQLPAVEAHPLIAWILKQAEIDVRQYRAAALNRRLPVILRQLRADSPHRAREILQTSPALLPHALSALLLGVSAFFRDSGVFRSLAERVVPDLASRAPGLRVWSAACSDGQELYSVAMLLAHANCLNGSLLLGTDCRADAIERARTGRYNSHALAGIAPQWHCYLSQEAGILRVSETIRQAIRWKVADLLARRNPGTWDLILWRNMAIYLDHPHAMRLWGQLTEALSLGGYLITGKAERPPAGLPLERVAPCVYQRVAQAPDVGRMWL